MTRTEVLKLIGLIRAAWSRDEMSPETAAVYAAQLSDLDFEAANAALVSLMRSTKFRPAISEIRELVAERTLAIPSAADAWTEVSERVRDYDDYEDSRKWPDWSHELIRLTVRDLGGLRALYYSNNPGMDRAHFLKLFREHRGEQIERATVGALPAPAPMRGLPTGVTNPAAAGQIGELRTTTAEGLRADRAQSDSEAS